MPRCADTWLRGSCQFTELACVLRRSYVATRRVLPLRTVPVFDSSRQGHIGLAIRMPHHVAGAVVAGDSSTAFTGSFTGSFTGLKGFKRSESLNADVSRL
jgi:hypothetical protein